MTRTTKLFWIDMAAYGLGFAALMLLHPVVGLVVLYGIIVVMFTAKAVVK